MHFVSDGPSVRSPTDLDRRRHGAELPGGAHISVAVGAGSDHAPFSQPRRGHVQDRRRVSPTASAAMVGDEVAVVLVARSRQAPGGLARDQVPKVLN